MARFKYERAVGKCEIFAEGDLHEVVAEIGFMLNKLHAGIKSQSEEAAAEFRKAMLIISMPGSPAWRDPEPINGETTLAIVTEK